MAFARFRMLTQRDDGPGATARARYAGASLRGRAARRAVDGRHDVITSTFVPGFDWVTVREPCAVPGIGSAPTVVSFFEHKTTNLGVGRSNRSGRANSTSNVNELTASKKQSWRDLGYVSAGSPQIRYHAAGGAEPLPVPNQPPSAMPERLRERRPLVHADAGQQTRCERASVAVHQDGSSAVAITCRRSGAGEVLRPPRCPAPSSTPPAQLVRGAASAALPY